MQKIIPNLWFNQDAEEAAQFYVDSFDDASSVVVQRYPETDLPDFQKDFAGRALVVDVRIGDTHFTLLNGGDTFAPNPSISFMLNFDPLMFDGDEVTARAFLTRTWDRLREGGTALMPLDEYPFSALYGWVQDRFGVSWQLNLTDPAGYPRPFLMPALLFSGPSQNRASEMVDFYLDLFPGSELGTRAPYTEATGPAMPGAVLYSDFRIGEQWLVAMDSSSEQPFVFSPGVSLSVQCHNQAEIDRLWEALSAVPEAEQCGWLVDRAGVSWQIVPENMAELLARPDGYEHMMQMKKLVIADF